jgi:hypothetical protein
MTLLVGRSGNQISLIENDCGSIATRLASQDLKTWAFEASSVRLIAICAAGHHYDHRNLGNPAKARPFI